jgi:hypothetical protein
MLEDRDDGYWGMPLVIGSRLPRAPSAVYDLSDQSCISDVQSRLLPIMATMRSAGVRFVCSLHCCSHIEAERQNRTFTLHFH